MKATIKLEYPNYNINWAAKNSPRFSEELVSMAVNKMTRQFGHDKSALKSLLSASINKDGVIGKNIYEPPYVAEIAPEGRLIKLEYKIDYTHANSKASRGVYIWFVLESGKTYEVFQPRPYKTPEKYRVVVNENGETERLLAINE